MRSRLYKALTLTLFFAPSLCLATNECDKSLGTQRPLGPSRPPGIVTPRTWAEIPSHIPSSRTILGRIAKIGPTEDWTTLASDKTRKVVFVMDRTGVDAVFKGPREGLFDALGLTAEYVRGLRAKGTQFYAIFFQAPSYPATWSGVRELIASHYSKSVREAFEQHFDELVRRPYARIAAANPRTMAEIYAHGPADKDYVTAARLSKRSSLWDVRAFLFNELRLTELYAGTGYTMTEDGQRGLPERLTVNADLTAIQDLQIMDLSAILATP